MVIGMVFISGKVMYFACCHLVAPSSMAASYKLWSMPVMVARYTTMLYPTPFHRFMNTRMNGQ